MYAHNRITLYSSHLRANLTLEKLHVDFSPSSSYSSKELGKLNAENLSSPSIKSILTLPLYNEISYFHSGTSTADDHSIALETIPWSAADVNVLV